MTSRRDRIRGVRRWSYSVAWLAIGALSGVWFVTVSGAQQSTTAARPAYVGSRRCQPCHAAAYERWSKTRMANVVRDPREHPDCVIPDFSKPDPLLTFT